MLNPKTNETRELLPFPNSDFADGETGWTLDKTRGHCAVVADPTGGDGNVLHIVAKAPDGAKAEGPRVPCRSPGIVELHGRLYGTSGRLLGLWIREYDAEGVMLPSSQKNWSELGATGGCWKQGLLVSQVVLDERTTELQVFLIAYPTEHETVDVCLADLAFVQITPPIPPYASQYKLRTEDVANLTAADVAGPDGIVYPNWTQVGVQGGIPDVPVAARLETFGGQPGTDISAALDRACRDLGSKGGGAIQIGEGTFYMDRPVIIRQNGVVIRGSGRDKTHIVFRYGVGQPGNEIGFYWPPENGLVGPDTQVEVHAYHMQLKRITLFQDGREVKRQAMNAGWTFAMTVPGAELAASGGGEVLLRAEAEFDDGHVAVAERRVRQVPEPQPVKAGPLTRALLYFVGRGLEPEEYALVEDGNRGDTKLVFKNIGNLNVGDKLDLHAPGTKRFSEQIQHRYGGDDWKRIGFFEILAIEGRQVTINQPLRIDFPVIDGSYARRMNPIERCGVEDLSIEHLSHLPISTIEFDWGWNGWVRNVEVLNTGCNGAYAERSKWIEIRDCVLDGAWNFDGGQAYAGFTQCADSLFENNVVHKYRHGPVVQYGAMGCVFRNSRFEGSDLQWHAGWSTENLFENCVIHSRRGTGSYGACAYATGSDDAGHGPNGPRNVVYNCDMSGQLGGVVLDGVNENWIFRYNRIVVEKGDGFTLRCGSFDHVLADNVVVLRDGVSPMVRLKTPDCVGIELIGNTLHGGNGKMVEGAAAPAVERGNRTVSGSEAALPDRPVAAQPSLYTWQMTGEDRM